MKFSIVTTLYQSENFVEEFYERICKTVSQHSDEFEIIFVNDGSPDNSLEKAVSLHQKDPRVKVINFSKNFGHHKAIMSGLNYSKGDYVFLIDSDLEEEPECFDLFFNELKSTQGVDMVYGVQVSRKGGFFERISGGLWYKFMNLMTQNSIPENFLTVRMMTRNYVNNLIQFKEHELNFSTIIHLNGFQTKKICLKKLDKKSSSYNLIKKLNITFNTITSATDVPLWMIFYSGLSITLLASILIAYIIFTKLFSNIETNGWTSLMVIVLFLGGLNIFMIGVIGIYISKIFIEVKNRPYTIIKNIFDKSKENNNE